MDWLTWIPRHRATLCFIIRHGHILLIRKKRGLGTGKINAPGGKIDPGESALEAAARETREETGLHPLALSQAGELSFQFADGYSLHTTVFTAAGCSGLAIETPEAIPHWHAVDQIPYGEMWEDDRLWIPLLLGGQPFTGFFEFDGDRMQSHEIHLLPAPVAS